MRPSVNLICPRPETDSAPLHERGSLPMPPPLEIALAEIDRNLHMEQELFAMAEEVAIEVNAEIPPADPMSFLPGPSIRREEDTPKFRFGSRFLEIRFF